jgi:hypothetical protein
MRYGLKLILSVAALGLLFYGIFQMRTPESASAPEKAVVASEDSNPAPPPKDLSSNLDRVPIGNVVAEQYGAVICPDSKAFEAFDVAWVRALPTNPPSDSTSMADAAKTNGCNYIHPGTSLVSEAETSNSGGSRPLVIVTAKMPDGTAIRGVTFSNMLYLIPKGDVVAADIGAIICPDANAITAYKDASTAWIDSNKPNMSAKELKAAARSSVEGLARSAGCNYVLPGASLVSEGGIEGGQGYGANLNLIVTAQMPDGTTTRGVTLPIMITQNQQPTAEPSAIQPEVPQELETQQVDAATQATKQAPTAGAVPVSPQAKAFTDCISSRATSGQYSSLDGGKSAMRLLGDCPDQWKKYLDACIRSGDTDGNCTLKTAILAQAALKLLNK